MHSKIYNKNAFSKMRTVRCSGRLRRGGVSAQVSARHPLAPWTESQTGVKRLRTVTSDLTYCKASFTLCDWYCESDDVYKKIITGRNEVVAKVIFLHLSVIHSVHGGGVSASVHTGIPHPPEPGTPPRNRHSPLGPGTPPGTKYPPLGLSTAPGTKYTPWD